MPDEFQTLKKESSIEIIKACNGSGMPKRQWCREHGISYSTFMRWQRILRNELAGEIMVTQAVVPLQIEPQASRCTPAQEVTIQKRRYLHQHARSKQRYGEYVRFQRANKATYLEFFKQNSRSHIIVDGRAYTIDQFLKLY
ncbi:transposase [Oscillospiraceae bacterium Marseille-Q3528]|nr:transposase [Oscillospiraceae bacterium Marseille-Q3528]